MKTPTWATVIGILMIGFGGCSIMNDFQAISLPTAIEKAKVEASKKMKEEQTKADSTIAQADSVDVSKATEDKKSMEEKQKEMEEILNIPEFSKMWIPRFGYIGVCAALVYIAGGIFLLIKRTFSIKLAYAALGLSILTSGAQAAFLTSSSSSGMISLWIGLGQIFGIVIDVILVAVIFSSEKEAYSFPTNP